MEDLILMDSLLLTEQEWGKVIDTFNFKVLNLQTVVLSVDYLYSEF